ncbi:hypothetical protein M3Y99_01809700 [Aphelenchoides fujianensis]|nr:hypothetical protein M3Y99_01809700 [Aphelenchoides fujianensis]
MRESHRFFVVSLVLVVFVLLLAKAEDSGELVEMNASTAAPSAVEGSGEGDEEASGSGEEVGGSGEGSGGGSGEEVVVDPNQVFPPNATRLFTPPTDLNLEEFAERDLSEATHQPVLHELSLDFQLREYAGQPEDELNAKYGRAFDTLLRIAPNLRIVHPIGGHFFFPDNTTMDDLKTEISFVRAGIAALTKQMGERNLTLVDENFDYVKYTLYIVIDEDYLNQTELEAHLKSEFGRRAFVSFLPSQSTVRSGTVLYDVNDVNIKLDLLVYADVDAVLDLGLESGERLDYKEVGRALSQLDRLELKQKVDEPIAKLLMMA